MYEKKNEKFSTFAKALQYIQPSSVLCLLWAICLHTLDAIPTRERHVEKHHKNTTRTASKEKKITAKMSGTIKMSAVLIVLVSAAVFFYFPLARRLELFAIISNAL